MAQEESQEIKELRGEMRKGRVRTGRMVGNVRRRTGQRRI